MAKRPAFVGRVVRGGPVSASAGAARGIGGPSVANQYERPWWESVYEFANKPLFGEGTPPDPLFDQQPAGPSNAFTNLVARTPSPPSGPRSPVETAPGAGGGGGPAPPAPAAQAPAPAPTEEPPVWYRNLEDIGKVEEEPAAPPAPETNLERRARGMRTMSMGLGQWQQGHDSSSAREGIGGMMTYFGGMMEMSTPAGMEGTAYGRLGPILGILGTVMNISGQRQDYRNQYEYQAGLRRSTARALMNLGG